MESLETLKEDRRTLYQQIEEMRGKKGKEATEERKFIRTQIEEKNKEIKRAEEAPKSKVVQPRMNPGKYVQKKADLKSPSYGIEGGSVRSSRVVVFRRGLSP